MSEKHKPLFSCTSCASDQSLPADELRQHDDALWCSDCWNGCDMDADTGIEYSDLPEFIPEADLKIRELTEALASQTICAAGCHERQKLHEALAKIDGLRCDILEEIEIRDGYCEVADRMANEIARFFGVDIGEHSNCNSPWDNAFEAIPDTTLAALKVEAADWLIHCLFHAPSSPISCADAMRVKDWWPKFCEAMDAKAKRTQEASDEAN